MKKNVFVSQFALSFFLNPRRIANPVVWTRNHIVAFSWAQTREKNNLWLGYDDHTQFVMTVVHARTTTVVHARSSGDLN